MQVIDRPVMREWSGRTIQDRVDLVMLQIQQSLRPEVTWIAEQILDEAGWQPGHGTRAAIDALFWGFRNRFRYTHDPWELDCFTNFYRAWLIGGGSPDGDLSKSGVIFEDCDGSVIGLGAISVSVAPLTGIRRFGAKVIGPGREFTHIYAGVEDNNGKVVFLDPTVSSFGPGQEAPAQYRKSERFFWFDPTRKYAGNVKSNLALSGLSTYQPPTLQDLDRSTPRSRIDGIVRRVYRSLRDPLTRISTITMLREAGCPARDDFCDAAAVLQGVQRRYIPAGPVGGSVRTLGQAVNGTVVGESLEAFAGDADDAVMTLCSLTLSIGFRSGVRTLPNGRINAIVQIPRSQSKRTQHRILDLPLESDVPVFGNGGTASWYAERH